MLREYLSMIAELREVPPGGTTPLRQPDLAALADALGGTPESIETRLVQLTGVSHEEAVRLRSMILPPRSLPSPMREVSHEDPYAVLRGSPDSPAIEQFFSGPAPVDPFAAERPLPVDFAAPPSGVAAPPPGWASPDAPEVVTPLIEPAAAISPLASPATPTEMPMTGAPMPPASDPFAGPVDPHAAAASVRDPFAPPSAEDPLAPRPLPPDPFAPPPPAWAEPLRPEPTASNGNGTGGVVIDDPFAPPPMVDDPAAGEHHEIDPPADPFGGLGLDAIVVDDPMRRDPGDDTVPEPPEPLRDDARPIIKPAEPIAWKATSDAPGVVPTVAPEPRFERATADWQIGGVFPATAMADDGTLALRRADARWALTNLSADGDCIVEASYDLRTGSGFGIVFRASVTDDRISGYSFDMDPIAGGGGYLVRLWDGSRQHWRPLAHAAVTDPARLFGHHVARLTVRGDQLSVDIDGDPVLEVPALSRATLEVGREPCRGDRVGIQAWATTEVTVESFRVASL